MIFYLIGIDYKRAPLSAREDVYRKRKAIDEYLAAGRLDDAEILHTCNRAELYGVAKNLFEARASIDIFRRHFSEFSRYGYSIVGQKNVFRHLLRLATGLESQIKGEPQILQQLQAWRFRHPFLEPFSSLVYEALSAAVDIRVRSGLDQAENNVAALVSKDLARRFEGRDRLEAVIAGTAKIAELFAISRHPQLYLYFAAHKNYGKAQELARMSGGEALMLKYLPEALLRIDVLISATSSPHSLFDENYFRNVLARRDKPLYVYDLAMPRDVSPDAAGLKGIILNDLDSLTGVFNDHNRSLRSNVSLAEDMVEDAVKEYEELLHEEDFTDGHAAQSLGLETS